MAEWNVQRSFIKLLIAGAFLLLATDGQTDWPDRTPRPDRIARLHFQKVDLQGAVGRGLTLDGAWTLSADDARVMGLSALAVRADGRLEALSDSGALVTFAPPKGDTAPALVSDLPGGPGYPTFKKYRDSEAMIVDADGRGRTIAFESRHSLWRFDADGTARKLPLPLPSAGWGSNKGIEAMVDNPAGGTTLLLHEGGRLVLRVTGMSAVRSLPLAGATGGVADAVRLPDGRIVVAVREIGLLGLTDRLAWLERTGAGYRLVNFATLPLGPLDNVEGLAAQADSDGRTILWAVTDNDGWRRTLLLRMTLDTRKAPA
ncbi:esterase-like activity of phytase family protein [Sphingomonas humi]